MGCKRYPVQPRPACRFAIFLLFPDPDSFKLPPTEHTMTKLLSCGAPFSIPTSYVGGGSLRFIHISCNSPTGFPFIPSSCGDSNSASKSLGNSTTLAALGGAVEV